jgi:hypothetical protein
MKESIQMTNKHVLGARGRKEQLAVERPLAVALRSQIVQRGERGTSGPLVE